MIRVLVMHTVQDFDRWRPFFESHADTRISFGCEEAELFRTADSPNQVTILFKWKDGPAFQKFVATSDLREVMQKGGVIGQPIITVMTDAGSYPG
jgi:quinol monooxygenase YgiN